MQKYSILVADRDTSIRSFVKGGLETEGFDVYEAQERADLLDMLQEQQVQAILLDSMFQHQGALHLIPDLKSFSSVPIIVVSARNQPLDGVLSLEMGADDFVNKPIDMRELCARIKANIKRHQSGGQSHLQDHAKVSKILFGGWTMDCGKFQIFDMEGKSGDLTIREFQLLEVLIRSAGRALSREQLFDLVRIDEDEAYDRAIDIQVMRIRRKIGDDAKYPAFLKTVRGVGYMFDGKTSLID